jgi:formate hydrogenlyase subunit 6/NADH:ubiquinone oxidoreductase subunit I
MLCVRECPDWCISIEAHNEVDPEAPQYSNARRPATKNVLDSFTINFGDCMWCGICIDVCPFDALFWSAEPLPVTTTSSDLVLDIDQLESNLDRALRLDGTPAPAKSDPPSGRRKK